MCVSVHDFCELQLETDTIETQCDVRQASKGLWLEEGKKRCRKRHQTREMSFEEKIQREKKMLEKMCTIMIITTAAGGKLCLVSLGQRSRARSVLMKVIYPSLKACVRFVVGWCKKHKLCGSTYSCCAYREGITL